jgi:hypothetical protein
MIRMSNYLKVGVLVGALVVTASAQAVVRSMTWYLQPNVSVKHSILAISNFLSAKCVTNITEGQLFLTINGQKRVLSPQKNATSFGQINGVIVPAEQKYGYTYSIVWKVAAAQHGVFTLVCEGDNHR